MQQRGLSELTKLHGLDTGSQWPARGRSAHAARASWSGNQR